MALDHCNAQYVHLLGVARLKVGQLPGAVDALRAACDLDPERANYCYTVGKALEQLGKRDAEARDAYERAVQLKPDCTKARLALGRLANPRRTG